MCNTESANFFSDISNRTVNCSQRPTFINIKLLYLPLFRRCSQSNYDIGKTCSACSSNVNTADISIKNIICEAVSW